MSPTRQAAQSSGGRRSEDDQVPVRLLALAPGDHLVLLDQLVLEPADVGILGREVHLAPDLPGPVDPLPRLLERRLGGVGRGDAVDPGESALDLGHGVAAQHLDGDARRLGEPDRRILPPVVVLEGQDDVGVLDVVLDAHRKLELAHRLLEVAPRDPVGKDRQRRCEAGRAVAPALPGLAAAALLVGDVLLDVEAAPAVLTLSWPASPTAEGRGLELAGRPPRLDPADDLSRLAAHPDLGWLVLAAERLVDSLGHGHVDRHPIALLDLDEDVEGGRRASSSERVTVWMPPSRSLRVGLTSRLSRVMPWAVPTSCTPRSAMVRAAAASSSVPISSMTMT